MKYAWIFILLLAVPAFSSEEKDQKKVLESQAKTLIEQAKELEKSGDLLEARKQYASSQAFWETKDAEKAIKHIDDEIRNRVKDALKRAHQLYDHGQFKPASEALESALELHSSGGILSYNLALCYFRMGDPATALGYLDEAISATADPKRSSKLKQLRTVWITGEQTTTATASDKDHVLYVNHLMEDIGFDASLDEGAPQLSGNSAPAPSVKTASFVKTSSPTDLHASTKQHQRASLCEALEAVQGPSANTPAMSFNRAICAEENDHSQRAAELLQHYLEVSPAAGDAARVHLRLADLKALLQLPDSQGAEVRSLYSAASRSLEERKFDRALAQFEKAAGVASDFAPTEWRIALMYEAFGNVERAREHFTRFSQLSADSAAQAEAQVHLDTLEPKRDQYTEEVGQAEDIIADLLNRAMNLTFNGMDDRAALYKQRLRAKQRQYAKKKKNSRLVGGVGVPFAYAQQQLSEAGEHLATALALFPLGAEANELMGFVYLQANDGRAAMRSFDAVASQNLPASFYAELRGRKKDHAVKCELTRDHLQLIFLSSYDKNGKPSPPEKNAGTDGLGDLLIASAESRKNDFNSLLLTPAQIRKVETKNGLLLLKLEKEDIALSPIYMPALTPTDGPQGRRFANNYTRMFVRYPGLEDSKLGAEGLTVGEKIHLTYDIGNAAFNIGSSLNPVGSLQAFQSFMQITKELHATAKSLHVNYAAWEKAAEDQFEFQNGSTFKMIPVEAATLTFAEELK
jgi:tetratricopeptide (TPR) repeat protein